MFVEVLDRYFGNVRTSALPPIFGYCWMYGQLTCVCGCLQVCELDIIFNFHKVRCEAACGP